MDPRRLNVRIDDADTLTFSSQQRRQISNDVRFSSSTSRMDEIIFAMPIFHYDYR